MSSGAVTRVPRGILRLEGLAVLSVSCSTGNSAGGLGVARSLLSGSRSVDSGLPGGGAATPYNLAHSYIGPILLSLATRSISSSWAVFAVLVRIAHIGFDRVVGYGLKYSSSTV